MHAFDLSTDRLHRWLGLVESVLVVDSINWESVDSQLNRLRTIDSFWRYPGFDRWHQLTRAVSARSGVLTRTIVQSIYRQLNSGSNCLPGLDGVVESRPVADVLVIQPDGHDLQALRGTLKTLQSGQDEFVLDWVQVGTVESAVAAVLSNTAIQAVVIRWGFAWNDPNDPYFRPFLDMVSDQATQYYANDPIYWLTVILKSLRPELDLYFASEWANAAIGADFRSLFRVVFGSDTPISDWHYYILGGIRDRYTTPFFNALRFYSQSGVDGFHALPIGQPSTVRRSPWISDLLQFYGQPVFQAETSATNGGLDSLLDPTGPLKQAALQAAYTFGSDRTYFVTNGTSTANKIVLQGLIRPGDWVLVSSDCHKSIPYGIMLSGGLPVFLDTVPISGVDLSGTVSLDTILNCLNQIKQAGQLHRVKGVCLTSATFDGIAYHALRYMDAIYGIQPDLWFHWDEAWFAFARSNPLYRGYTALSAASQLHLNGKSVRVYVTQSTHKTLTAFRQSAMIHMIDPQFNEMAFVEAYRIHTSTSPNYQLLASLDVGRRQVSLEGFERTQTAIRLALTVRKRLTSDPLLARYYPIVTPIAQSDSVFGYLGLCHAVKSREWMVDPTRITLDVRETGMTGANFRELLMNRFHIQINKTSYYTILIIVNIGNQYENIDRLLDVLTEIAARIELERANRPLPGLTPNVELPVGRCIHPVFSAGLFGGNHVLDLRRANYMGLDPTATDRVKVTPALLESVINGAEIVCAAFITPYPPGYPLLVPGQVISAPVLRYLLQLKPKEVHGMLPDRVLPIFKSEVLK